MSFNNLFVLIGGGIRSFRLAICYCKSNIIVNGGIFAYGVVSKVWTIVFALSLLLFSRIIFYCYYYASFLRLYYQMPDSKRITSGSSNAFESDFISAVQ